MFDFKQKLQIRNKTNSIVLHHAAASISVAASAVGNVTATLYKDEAFIQGAIGSATWMVQ